MFIAAPDYGIQPGSFSRVNIIVLDIKYIYINFFSGGIYDICCPHKLVVRKGFYFLFLFKGYTLRKLMRIICNYMIKGGNSVLIYGSHYFHAHVCVWCCNFELPQSFSILIYTLIYTLACKLVNLIACRLIIMTTQSQIFLSDRCHCVLNNYLLIISVFYYV